MYYKNKAPKLHQKSPLKQRKPKNTPTIQRMPSLDISKEGLYAFPLPDFTFYESFAAMANLLQVRLIKMKLLSLLTHGKFHELQFV